MALHEHIGVSEEEQIHHIHEAHRRVRNLLQKTGMDALVVSRQNMFSYLTGGEENIINANSEKCNVYLVYTKEKRYVVMPVGEQGTVDETLFTRAGFDFCIYPWAEVQDIKSYLQAVADTDKMASDDGIFSCVYEELLGEAGVLTPYGIKLYKALARDVGAILDTFAKSVKPGIRECEAAAYLHSLLITKGIQPNVLLLGGDERVLRSRHFVATRNTIANRMMVIACFRRNGLVLSQTRDIYFSKPEQSHLVQHEKLAELCAHMVLKTCCGSEYDSLYKTYGGLFERFGLGKEFYEHPVAGLTGYEIREKWIAPGEQKVVQLSTAYAFNPCINGYKSEDTFILGPSGFDLLAYDHWPYKTYDGENTSVKRPAPLVLN